MNLLGGEGDSRWQRDTGVMNEPSQRPGAGWWGRAEKRTQGFIVRTCYRGCRASGKGQIWEVKGSRSPVSWPRPLPSPDSKPCGGALQVVKGRQEMGQ